MTWHDNAIFLIKIDSLNNFQTVHNFSALPTRLHRGTCGFCFLFHCCCHVGGKIMLRVHCTTFSMICSFRAKDFPFIIPIITTLCNVRAKCKRGKKLGELHGEGLIAIDCRVAGMIDDTLHSISRYHMDSGSCGVISSCQSSAISYVPSTTGCHDNANVNRTNLIPLRHT